MRGRRVRCGRPCPDECCLIAELIFEAQTGCYPRCRARAVQGLGQFDCQCHPEVMSALVYSLNDADPNVRATAAQVIARQLRCNPCCCSPCVISALTCALADCAFEVRRAAERALCACGYSVIDQCCGVGCCDMGACCPAGGYQPAAVPVDEEAAPAPAPPEEPSVYFPRSQPKQADASFKQNLSRLFSMAK